MPVRSKASCCGSSERRRCSRRAFARPPRARCSCRDDGRGCGRRCGSSASAPRICSPSRRASARSRHCSKPIARCCAITSTCRRSSTCCAGCPARTLRLTTIDSKAPSPFAASLLFSYVANYIYDGDAPLAERRAQALSVDQAQLRELLGDAELRELLDPDALDLVERQLQHLDPSYRVQSADGLHDLLIRIGDLTADEIEARSAMADTAARDREPRAARGASSSLPIGGERALCRRRRRRAVPRWPGHSPAARSARIAARAGARPGRRPRAALRAIAWPVQRPHVRGALRPGHRGRRIAADAAGRSRASHRGRVPARRHRSRVGRCRRPAPAAQPLARTAAAAGRAGRDRRARPVPRLVARHRLGETRRRRPARRHRAAAGRAAHGIGPRARDPAGARRGLSARRCSTR